MEKEQEKMVLSHKPEPAYRIAFYITLALGVIYLVAVFFKEFF